MITLNDLDAFLNTYLACDTFSDYAPNGLQVEGRAHVARIVTGVSASYALLERALQEKADAVLVHHGYFWKGEDARLVGMKKRRIEMLVRNDISLFAFHLPLDAHPEIGNNAQLGRRLGLQGTVMDRHGLIWAGDFLEPMTHATCSDMLARALGRTPLHVGPDAGAIRRVMWCTGAGQKYLSDAARLGADAFISGEISEQTTHEAREQGVHYFAAGHHATERDGIAALGALLAQRFGLQHLFVDLENPV